MEHICSIHNKKGIEDFGYGNGYVYTKEEFGRFLNRLTDVIEAKCQRGADSPCTAAEI